jgi:hypothetical protein
MLDFYIISDSEEKPKPDKIDQLDYAGGLESDIFDRLVRKGIIDSRFDFYSDFRWGNQLVRQIDSKTKEYSNDSDIKALKNIVDKAVNSESGLIAFAD